MSGKAASARAGSPPLANRYALRSLRERAVVGRPADGHRPEGHDVHDRRRARCRARPGRASSPLAEVSANRSPTPSRCSRAQPSSTIAPSRPRPVGHAVVAARPVEGVHAADGGRLDGVDRLLVAEGEPAVLADAGDADARAGHGGLDGRVGRRPAVGAGDDVRGGHAVLERAARRVLQARGDDRDERDQGDADGQRGRGGQRAARLAHRVAAGEPAGRAAHGLPGAAEQRGERRAPRGRGAAGGPLAAIGAAQRRHRRDARGPPGRDRGPRPASRPCPRRATRRSCARRTPCPRRAGRSPWRRTRRPGPWPARARRTGPTSDAPAPISSASDSTEPSTWRRSAPTIRSSPSSRVRWATVIESVLKIVKAPTRMATPPNTSRTTRMIPMNCFRPSRVKRSWAAADDHRGLRHGGGDRRADVRGRHAVAPADEDAVDPVAALEQLLRRAQVEHRGGGRAQRLDRAEAGDADHLVAGRVPARGDPRRRADARSAPARPWRRRGRPRPARSPSGRRRGGTA